MSQNNVKYLVGDKNIERKILKPFDERLVDFCDALSKELIKNESNKKYPDIITFAFYIRKANIIKLKEQYYKEYDRIRKLGRGIVFHIAPSNVPINFAYSLFAGLILGNTNIVKVSSKDFIQVKTVCDAILDVIIDCDDIKGMINIVRYNNEKEVNDYFSSICDVRVIWGGDRTIEILRESKLKPRAREVAFADRYSLAVIDLDYYKNLSDEDKNAVATGFYNDTYLSDQNACTSPRLICFIGDCSAKEEFYDKLYKVVKSKYDYQTIFSTNKLLDANKFAINYHSLNPKIIKVNGDNLIIRLTIDKLDRDLVNFEGNTGLFVECDINGISELNVMCNIDKVQTISYIGNNEMFDKLLNCNLCGVDRIVPTGKTMDFNIIWDGYNLVEMFTRNIEIL